MTAEIDVAWLNANGTLQLPENVTDIMIEIGANSRNTMDIEVLPKRATSFLITFEPILDKYATLLSRNSRADTKSILGRHHTRGTVLPYAVAANDGFATFHMSPVDGCSSLLASQFSRFGGLCAPTEQRLTEERRVPTVALSTILGRWLAWEGGGGWPVSRMKIDAQGFDLDLFASLPNHLMKRVEQVEMETNKDGCHLMYNGTSTKTGYCSGMVRTMSAFGYRATTKSGHIAVCSRMKYTGTEGCEAELVFTRHHEGKEGRSSA